MYITRHAKLAGRRGTFQNQDIVLFSTDARRNAEIGLNITPLQSVYQTLPPNIGETLPADAHMVKPIISVPHTGLMSSMSYIVQLL